MRQISYEIGPSIGNAIGRRVNKVDDETPFALSRGDLWSRRLSGKVRLRCLQGIVWVTQAHDTQDYLLRAGDCIELSGGHPVVQALQNAIVEIDELPVGEKHVTRV